MKELSILILSAIATLNLAAGQSPPDQYHSAGTMDMVLIDNPGNPPDPVFNYKGGQVNYEFLISKYEITNAQYVAFLNAVGKEDKNQIYKDGKTSAESVGHITTGANGEKITTTRVKPLIIRSGEPGAYSHEVKPGYEDVPVWNVSWFDAARYVNWLHNGQPSGAQTILTTEDGAYPLRDRSEGVDIPRRPQAKYWLPSADEWHKAAYHDPSLPPENQYNKFATGSDQEPKKAEARQLLVTNPGPNTLAFSGLAWPVPVGACGNKSAYGVCDMMGNVDEWTDQTILDKHRGIRGGGVRSGNITKDQGGVGSDPAKAGWMVGIRVASKSSDKEQASRGDGKITSDAQPLTNPSGTQRDQAPADRIRQIKSLLDHGQIQQDEYDRRVKEILDSI